MKLVFYLAHDFRLIEPFFHVWECRKNGMHDDDMLRCQRDDTNSLFQEAYTCSCTFRVRQNGAYDCYPLWSLFILPDSIVSILFSKVALSKVLCFILTLVALLALLHGVPTLLKVKASPLSFFLIEKHCAMQPIYKPAPLSQFYNSRRQGRECECPF